MPPTWEANAPPSSQGNCNSSRLSKSRERGKLPCWRTSWRGGRDRPAAPRLHPPHLHRPRRMARNLWRSLETLPGQVSTIHFITLIDITVLAQGMRIDLYRIAFLWWIYKVGIHDCNCCDKKWLFTRSSSTRIFFGPHVLGSISMGEPFGLLPSVFSFFSSVNPSKLGWKLPSKGYGKFFLTLN